MHVSNRVENKVYVIGAQNPRNSAPGKIDGNEFLGESGKLSGPDRPGGK